jgi:hypothetical protein
MYWTCITLVKHFGIPNASTGNPKKMKPYKQNLEGNLEEWDHPPVGFFFFFFSPQFCDVAKQVIIHKMN